MPEPVSLASRLKGAISGLAVCDALGGPVEFKSRDSFEQVTAMLPNDNFGLPASCFTDDTSMALCLAHSLLDCDGNPNTVDQVKRYISWFRDGYMSSIGICFDIGASTQMTLALWETSLSQDTSGGPEAHQEILNNIIHHFAEEKYCGNGSLMRVLPAALISSRKLNAVRLARESSLPTHPHPRCVEACMIYVSVVQHALDRAGKEELALTLGNLINEVPNDVFAVPIDRVLSERIGRYRSLEDWEKTHVKLIRSTGYVVDTLEASLWAFFTSKTFEDAAVRAVNLGDDADTVAAICGGLSGGYYGFDEIPQQWVTKMKKKELLDEVSEKLMRHRVG